MGTGVPHDDVVRKCRGERGSSSKETNHSASASDRPVRNFLRPHDFAHRGAGTDHSVAKQHDQDFASGKPGVVGTQRQGHRGKKFYAGSIDPGATLRSYSVYPEPVVPDSVNPGCTNTGSIDPGSAAAPLVRSGQEREARDPASRHARFGFNRPAPLVSYDLKFSFELPVPVERVRAVSEIARALNVPQTFIGVAFKK
jgi:hypothetical protein